MRRVFADVDAGRPPVHLARGRHGQIPPELAEDAAGTHGPAAGLDVFAARGELEDGGAAQIKAHVPPVEREQQGRRDEQRVEQQRAARPTPFFGFSLFRHGPSPIVFSVIVYTFFPLRAQKKLSRRQEAAACDISLSFLAYTIGMCYIV